MGVNITLQKCIDLVQVWGEQWRKVNIMLALHNPSAVVKLLSFPQAAPGPGDPGKQRSSVGEAGNQQSKAKPKQLGTCGMAG